MRNWLVGSMIATSVAVVVFLLAPVPVAGQAAAAIPRTADGHPDFSGIWQVMNTAAWDIQDHSAQKGVPAGLGVVEGNELPYKPAMLAKKQENYKNRATADPEAKCYLPGVPRITYMNFPFQIFQTPAQITILYEYVHAVRYVYTNGTPHPPGQIEWWMGDSRAKWEGDTLVVDNIHFNNETWLDRAGNFHSENMHVVERISFTDRDHLNYEATIDDPTVFTRPWKMTMPIYRHLEKNFQLLEYECYTFDNEFHVTPPGTPAR